MNLALFDFDGTITVGDTFVPFIRFAVRSGRLVLGAVMASPHTLAYRLGVISASQARPAVARAAFRGERADRVRLLGRRYAQEVLPQCLRQDVLERVMWHKRQGDTVVVVSASLDVYLAPWCEAWGVALICTELEENGDLLTGRYCAGDCSGLTKAERVRQRYDLTRYAVVYAYGDSTEDEEMLALAHRRYFRGVERSAHEGWLTSA
jgi:phosphatidylglycerophosphatase C